MLLSIAGRKSSGKDTVGLILQYLDSKSEVSFAEGRKELIHNEYDISPKEMYRIKDSSYQIKKFAEKLKQMVCILIGCTREQLEDEEFKSKELSEEGGTIEYLYLCISSNTVIEKKSAYSKDALDIASRICNFGEVLITKLTPRTLLQRLGTECGREILHPNIWVNSLFIDYKGKSNCKENGNCCNEDESCKMIYPNGIITDVRFKNEARAIKDRNGVIIRIENPRLEKKTDEHESETALDDYIFDYTIVNDGSIEDLIEKVKIVAIATGLIKEIQ